MNYMSGGEGGQTAGSREQGIGNEEQGLGNGEQGLRGSNGGYKARPFPVLQEMTGRNLVKRGLKLLPTGAGWAGTEERASGSIYRGVCGGRGAGVRLRQTTRAGWRRFPAKLAAAGTWVHPRGGIGTRQWSGRSLRRRSDPSAAYLRRRLGWGRKTRAVHRAMRRTRSAARGERNCHSRIWLRDSCGRHRSKAVEWGGSMWRLDRRRRRDALRRIWRLQQFPSFSGTHHRKLHRAWIDAPRVPHCESCGGRLRRLDRGRIVPRVCPASRWIFP